MFLFPRNMGLKYAANVQSQAEDIIKYMNFAILEYK